MREVVCGVGVKYSTKIMPVKTDMSRPQQNYEEEVSTVGGEKDIWYEFKVYLFACWKLYSILRTFIPGPKSLFANNYFRVSSQPWCGAALAPTMVCGMSMPKPSA